MHSNENVEDLLGHLDFHVLLDRDLAGEPVAAGGLTLGDVRFLGRQDRPAARMYPHPALRAGAATAAGGGDEHLLARQRLQQLAAGRDRDRLFAVDGDVDVARAHQLGACRDDHGDQRKHDYYYLKKERCSQRIIP